jgi:hypothetical protein
MCHVKHTILTLANPQLLPLPKPPLYNRLGPSIAYLEGTTPNSQKLQSRMNLQHIPNRS